MQWERQGREESNCGPPKKTIRWIRTNRRLTYAVDGLDGALGAVGEDSDDVLAVLASAEELDLLVLVLAGTDNGEAEGLLLGEARGGEGVSTGHVQGISGQLDAVAGLDER